VLDAVTPIQDDPNASLGYSAVPPLWVDLFSSRQARSRECALEALAPGNVYVVQATNFVFVLCFLSDTEVIYSGYYHQFDARVISASTARALYQAYATGDNDYIEMFHGIRENEHKGWTLELEPGQKEKICEVDFYPIDPKRRVTLATLLLVCLFEGDGMTVEERAENIESISDSEKVATDIILLKYCVVWTHNFARLLALTSEHSNSN